MGEAIGIVGQRLEERRAGRPGLRPDDQVDVRDLIAVANQRFTDVEVRGHTCLPGGCISEERQNFAKHTQLGGVGK
jgi:hypothetical protein